MRAFGGLALLIVVMAALVFIPAGTVRYGQAWVFLAVYFAWSVAVIGYLMKRDPALLRRRMRGGPTSEQEPAQKLIMLFASVGFAGLLIVPALDHRFGWSHMPRSVAAAGDIFVALGWAITFLVLKENTFASSTIELAAGQTVVSTGPYAWVRHPMYSGGIVMLAGIPLALGSWWGLAVFGVLVPVLIWRLFEEERFLERGLPGYVEYEAGVRHRLIPKVW